MSWTARWPGWWWSGYPTCCPATCCRNTEAEKFIVSWTPTLDLELDKKALYLFESLLILPVLEGVDKGVDGGGHPGEDGGDDVEGGHVNIVVYDVDKHEGEEADEEGDEDGEHHLGEAQVLLPLRGRHARLLPGVGRCVLLNIQPE